MKWKDKWKQLKNIYQDVGYDKKFRMLFSLIIVTAIIEIITVPLW